MSVVASEVNRQSPHFSGPTMTKGVTNSTTIATATTPKTFTIAELLKGLLVVDTQDAGTYTTPTAALIRAGIKGCEVGTAFEFTIINYGDSTLTIGLGTGVTITVIATVDAVLTIATLTSKRFRLECTGILDPFVPGSADSWVLWTIGASSAVVS